MQCSEPQSITMTCRIHSTRNALISSLVVNRDDKATLGNVNVQQYIEDLNKLDPVISMPDDFVMVSKSCVQQTLWPCP